MKLKRSLALLLTAVMTLNIPQNGYVYAAQQNIQTEAEGMQQDGVDIDGVLIDDAQDIETETSTSDDVQDEISTDDELQAEEASQDEGLTDEENADELQADEEVGEDETAEEDIVGEGDETADGEGDETAIDDAEEIELISDEEEFSDEILMYSDEDFDEYVLQDGGLSFYEEPLDASYTTAQNAIYKALLKGSSSIDVSGYGIPNNLVPTVVSGVLNEHPDLYFVVGGYSWMYSGSTGLVSSIMFTNNKSKYDNAAFNRAVNKALSMVDDDMSDLEKAIIIHDYLAVNTKYSSGNGTNYPTDSYSAYGVLVKHDAVCQGYALAYKYLLNKLGIECGMVTSEKLNHAWNYVKLDGQYYNVDVTWDDPTYDTVGHANHKYMFISDSLIKDTAHRHNSSDWQVYLNSNLSSARAISTKYDSVYWQNASDPIVYVGGNFYYFVQENLYKTDDAVKAGTKLAKLSKSGRGLWSLDGKLFFTGFDGIYSVDTNGNNQKRICNVSSIIGSAFVYNCADDAMYINIENSYGRGFFDVTQTIGVKKCVVEFYDKHNKLLSRQIIYSGQNAAPPQIPNEKGCTNGSWDKSYKGISADTVITAKYELIPYSISYNLNKTLPIDNSGNPSVYTVEDSFDIKNLVLPGYTFLGWYKNKSFSGSKVTAISEGTTGNITLYAKWKTDVPNLPELQPKDEYKVLDNGVIMVDAGTGIEISEQPNATTYYTTNGKTPTKTSTKYEGLFTVDKDITVKAITYRENTAGKVATVKYKAAQNLPVLNKEEIQVEEGSAFKLEVVSMPDEAAENPVTWKSANTSTAKVDNQGNVTGVFEGTTTIKAVTKDWRNREVVAEVQVTVVPRTFTVTLKGFGQRVIDIQKVYDRHNATKPDSVYAPEGYVFDKWSRSFDEKITDNTEITASFKLKDYTLTYHTDKGKLAKSSDTFNAKSADIETLLPTNYGSDCYFAGWYDNEDYEGSPITVINKGTTGNIDLYAKFAANPTMRLRFAGKDFGEGFSAEYTGKAIKPEFEVYFGDKKLENGKDYTFSYKNNTNVNCSGNPDKDPMVVIKGKGNYSGQLTASFSITPKSIANADIVNVAVAYNKKVQKKAPTVSVDGRKLSTKEVVFSYDALDEDDYKEPGTYDVKITGIGNYWGERAATIQIVDSKADGAPILMSKCKVTVKPIPYTGEKVDFSKDEYKAYIKITQGKNVLPEESYEFTYGNCVDIGTYSLAIKGIEEKGYTGELRTTFKITGTAISTAKIDALPSFVYDGTAKKPEPVLRLKDGTVLTEANYDVDYINNVSVGTATVVITGKGQYTGTVKKTFKITALPVPDATELSITLPGNATEQPYEKGGSKPKPVVKYNSIVLKEGTDYTLAYKNNTSVNPKPGKEPYIVLTGKKNFKGTINIPFSIVPADIGKLDIKAADMQEAAAGKYMSNPVVTDKNGKKLAKKTDYNTVIEYRDSAGNLLDKKSKPVAGDVISVRVYGVNNYTGYAETRFRIFEKGKSIAGAKITVLKDSTANLIFSGEPVTLKKSDLTVMMGKIELTGDDYYIKEVSYTGNRSKGTAKVTIVGRGQYAGEKTISYTIKPRALQWLY